MPTIYCSHCGAKHTLTEQKWNERAGTNVKCLKCHEPMLIPPAETIRANPAPVEITPRRTPRSPRVTGIFWLGLGVSVTGLLMWLLTDPHGEWFSSALPMMFIGGLVACVSFVVPLLDVIMVKASNNAGAIVVLVPAAAMGLLAWVGFTWLCAGAPGVTPSGVTNVTKTDPYEDAIRQFANDHPELPEFSVWQIAPMDRWANGERRMVSSLKDTFVVYFRGHRVVSIRKMGEDTTAAAYIWRED